MCKRLVQFGKQCCNFRLCETFVSMHPARSFLFLLDSTRYIYEVPRALEIVRSTRSIERKLES